MGPGFEGGGCGQGPGFGGALGGWDRGLAVVEVMPTAVNGIGSRHRPTRARGAAWAVRDTGSPGPVSVEGAGWVSESAESEAGVGVR